MKGKVLLLLVVLVALYLLGQYAAWTVQRYDYVYNYMYEFTSPRIRRTLAAGHDALMADLAMIRGIQFYGRNYPLFDKHPVKYDQFKSLGKSVSDTDPRYGGAYRFWGFAFTGAERGKVDSYRYLIDGAHKMCATSEISTATRPAFGKPIPDMWQVAKDAGYVAVYELGSATPEWGCAAYRLAQKSSECPDFLRRLEFFACKAIDPDPIPPLFELAEDAVKTNNVPLKQLNIDHIRRIIASEHKTFWHFASTYYKEVKGATPSSINDLKSVAVMKEACRLYREMSSQWFPDGRTRLYPNLLNPNAPVTEPPQVKEAVEPELPIDPYGGEYLILTINNATPTLVATGDCLRDRKNIIDQLDTSVAEYKKKHSGQLPPDYDSLVKDQALTMLRADMYGYPVQYDPATGQFSFPPISEKTPPPLPPYGQTTEDIKKMMDEEAAKDGQSPFPPQQQ